MHPRQLSKWRTISGESSLPGSRPARMRTIRPRGESISSLHSWYVGHVGRQNPQWTQSSMRSGCGGLWWSNARSIGVTAISDPSDEDAPVANARRVEARLDATHELELGTVRPVPRVERGADALGRVENGARPRGQRAPQLRDGDGEVAVR